MKLLKGSQLRRFGTRQEAEDYSRRPAVETEEPVAKEDGAEKSTVASFRSVPTRDLVPFRRCIEKGDSDHVKQTIWSNPRYLISSGDSAVILMAGPRYNACHVAAKADKGPTLKLVLETVSNPEFVRSLYVSDDEETTNSRCQVLLDCYLNTPDQGVGSIDETSLCTLHLRTFVLLYRHTILPSISHANSDPCLVCAFCSHTRSVIEPK